MKQMTIFFKSGDGDGARKKAKNAADDSQKMVLQTALGTILEEQVRIMEVRIFDPDAHNIPV